MSLKLATFRYYSIMNPEYQPWSKVNYTLSWYALSFYPKLKSLDKERLKKIAAECGEVMGEADHEIIYINEPVFCIPSFYPKRLTGGMVFTIAILCLYLFVEDEVSKGMLESKHPFLKDLDKMCEVLYAKEQQQEENI
jgi:hypothetical protein